MTVAGYPGTATAVDAARLHAEVTADTDHGFLKALHVGNDVDGLGQRDDRIADQLAGPVPGNVAAAVDINDRRARIGDRAVKRGGALARRVHRVVLEQQARVRDVAANALLVHLPL